MLKISAVYRFGTAEIPIHYTTWAEVEQALLDFRSELLNHFSFSLQLPPIIILG